MSAQENLERLMAAHQPTGSQMCCICNDTDGGPMVWPCTVRRLAETVKVFREAAAAAGHVPDLSGRHPTETGFDLGCQLCVVLAEGLG